MALVRCNVFCVSMLLLCLAINWNLSQRQAALRGREDESVAEALGELGRLASDTTVKGTPNVHLPRRAAPARTPLLSGLGGHARLDDTSKLSKLSKEINSTLSSPQQAGMATWMDGISRTSQPPQASMDHPINTTATLLRRHRRSSPMGDSRKERASALARAVTEGLHQRVSALRKSATLDRIGLGSLMHSRREVEQGKHQKVHVPLEDNGRGTIELQQDDIRPIPTETVTYEKQRQVTKRADNFHNLITASRGRVSGCRVKRSAERPGINGLPLEVNRYIAYEDMFVHQGNFRRLLGRENFTDLKSPHLLPESAEGLFLRYGFNSCAIVGNSGSMLYARFGPRIDTHDVVFRINQAPTKGYEEFVGRKATFRLLNSLWTHRYSTVRPSGSLAQLRQVIWGGDAAGWSDGQENVPDATKLPLERRATLIVSRCSVAEYSKLLEFWHRRRPDVTVLMLNSRLVSVVRALTRMYRIRMCRAGWGPFEGGEDPSSGLVASYLAHQLCPLSSVYGFGADRVAVNDAHTPYHYYKFYGARRYGNTKAHSFDTELNMMAQLYNTSAPHPFPGHRVSGIAEAQAGNLRMCRAEPGYIANVHNTRCKAGWEEPSRGNKLRKEGPLKLSEIDEVEKMHRGWGIPFPITDMQWISGKHPPYQQQQG